MEDNGYNKIVDTFQIDKMNSFAYVIVVNLLHANLPK
jgi:hypothetical protein